MRATAAIIEREVFAANRATGRVALRVGAVAGLTRRRRVHEEGSLRVRFPNAAPGSLEAVLVNTAGGIAGGDRLSIELDVGEGASLLAGTAAAEKIYRSTGADAQMHLSLKVADRARLAWLPQETILFDEARLSRHISVDVAQSASVVAAEAIVFGRTAMGEAVKRGAWRDQWRVRRGGKLVFAENVRLDGAIAEKLEARAAAAGSVALATVLIAPGAAQMLADVRAIDFKGEGGISAWQDIAVARLVAPDGLTLRRDLVSLLSALRTTVPQLWFQ